MARNQLAHVEAEVQDLRSAHEELQLVLRRLANSKAEITCLQELLPQEKPVKRLGSYKKLTNLAASKTDNIKNNYRRRRRQQKKLRHSTLVKWCGYPIEEAS